MERQSYRVQGMDCAECARTVETGVARLEGVDVVRVDFATTMLHIEGAVSTDTVRRRVEALGYRLEDSTAARPAETTPAAGQGLTGFVRYLLGREASRPALAGGALLALGFALGALGLPDAAAWVFVAATVIALLPVARSGLNNLLINRTFNMNLLMSIAAVGALLIGETAEAATVVFLFAIGEALEGYTADRARDSLRSLLALAPARALRLMDGREEEVEVEALAPGDRIIVKPGERIPADGEVTAGMSGVDQAPITGESLPVTKAAGDAVFAGTINGAGALEIRVTSRAADSTLSRIIRLVEEAQNSRAPSQRFVNRFAAVYTPAVVAVAALVAVVPPLIFGAPFYNTATTQGWLYRALELLVIACPCALVISTPVTVISAITAAARRGVLIKGGAHLETLGGVRVFAFDKTGTLTRGRPAVVDVRSLDCASGEACADCDEVLALASAVERRSTHPLAKAITEAAHARGLDDQYAPAEAVETLAGRGVQGRVGGRLVTVGSHALFDAEHPHPGAVCAAIENAEAHGQTTVLLCDGERVRGYLTVSDEARPGSREVIAALKALEVQTVMLTGDNAAAAASIGRELGVDDVRANLLPADKVAAVEKLGAASGGRVAMVGDGINDTPALAAASVGIAMGGAGSAQALETADIALMADDLAQLPYAVRLSRFARVLIAQNIAVSIGIKLVFVVLALAGGASLWAAVFADMGTAILVTLNGMRPLRLK